jgi:hypothetical protein
MKTQPDLFPEPSSSCASITVQGMELGTATKRLRELGAVVLGFSVKGSTYTIDVILPDGMTLADAINRGEAT